MKNLLSFLILLSVNTCFSQKITVNEVDKFTKQKRVETSTLWIKQGLACGAGFYLRCVNDSYYISIQGYGCSVGVIGADDDMMLLLDNDSTVTVKPTGVQDYQIGQYNKSYDHQYRIAKDQIEMLAQHNLVSIRRYYTRNYVDTEVPKNKQSELAKTCSLFLKTVN